MSTKIKNWDNSEYTLDELLEFIKASNELEVDLSDVIDGDLTTASTIMSGLIDHIKSLEETVLKTYSILSNREVSDLDEAIGLLTTAAYNSRQKLLDLYQYDK